MRHIFWTVLALVLASQVYWALRARSWAHRHIRTRSTRLALETAALVIYAVLFADAFGFLGRRATPTSLTAPEALFRAPFAWWFISSLFGALIALLLAIPKGILWAVARLRRRRSSDAPDLVSPGRRHLLERAAGLAVASPFVAGAYGLFYGRLNLQVSKPRIRLARLPKAFEGFRIAQLSDIHIGPFMTEEQIRQYADITNSLKPDLIVLTGDFVTFDPSTEQALVRALSGLRAPFGVFGTLGNHDFWSGVQESLPRLFAQAGIRILRYERSPLQLHGEKLNLIGVDFESLHRFGPSGLVVHRYLEDARPLIAPDAVNILLTHNPDTFDRAAELGIDLSLAGHTHGGQLALEFISPQLAPSRLVTPYVSGWFEKPGGQLYVNRGIGTIGVPMRVGAPPEITVFELVRST